jgi:hypothetical protein
MTAAVVSPISVGDGQAERIAPRLDDIQRLRMRFAGKDDFAALVAMMAHGHADGLGTAVASSSSEADATGRPVSSATSVWK